MLIDLGATLEKVRPEVERLLTTQTEEPGPEPRPGLQPYKIGDRVLVHDPDPLYRLREGRVAKVEGKRHEISIPGRSEGELVHSELLLIHPVPMRWTHDCPFCGAG